MFKRLTFLSLRVERPDCYSRSPEPRTLGISLIPYKKNSYVTLCLTGGMIIMSQRFDELKQKIEQADKDKIMDIIQQVKKEKDQGNIDEDEKQTLIDKAKDKVGGSLGKFGL